MLWDDDADEPGTAHGYNYDAEDDERELMQRTCDCIDEHAPGFTCTCVCHPRRPDMFQRGPTFDSAGTFQSSGTIWVCADCYAGDHSLCTGLRANGELCECRRCGDAAEWS